MTGKSKYIYILLYYVQRQYSCALSAVHYEDQSIFPAYLTCLGYGHNSTGEVGSMQHTHHAGVRLYSLAYILRIKTAVIRTRDRRPFDPPPGKRIQGPGYSIMFHTGTYYMVARMKKTF
jgi:hypothetical protein